MVGQWLASLIRRPSASSRRSSWELFKSPLDGGSPETLSSPYVNRWEDKLGAVQVTIGPREPRNTVNSEQHHDCGEDCTVPANFGVLVLYV